ncbi:hypothetical protein [Lactococcus garvieae]|uniref:Uncharacterized protein n=1 Tax=Lactococcus garvieae TaxID=1363 RepID=A0AA46YR61_9LACT|nr:hypothetical protein [Lactococcus garvieae]UYT10710.1 hypothetical protein OF801_01855 [Lactococcus garvieae]UYT12752.1 hypothetical protein OF800_01855 [Lactococcus garvieae]
MNNLVKQVEEKDINEIKEFVDETLKVTKQQIDNPDESVRYYPTLKLTTLEVPATLILSMIKLLDHYQEQPKLSIPKKVAEIADETWDYGDIDPLDIFGDVRLPDFEKWWKSQEHPKDLIVAYLAGKALGVELVEVTDE